MFSFPRDKIPLNPPLDIVQHLYCLNKRKRSRKRAHNTQLWLLWLLTKWHLALLYAVGILPTDCGRGFWPQRKLCVGNKKEELLKKYRRIYYIGLIFHRLGHCRGRWRWDISALCQLHLPQQRPNLRNIGPIYGIRRYKKLHGSSILSSNTAENYSNQVSFFDMLKKLNKQKKTS